MGPLWTSLCSRTCCSSSGLWDEVRLRCAPENLATPLRCSLQLHMRVFFTFYWISGCQNNVSFGKTVPEGFVWYLYPTRCGAVLGPWTCRSERKWNRRQARKGRFCSTGCWTWAFLGVCRQNIRRKMKRWMENSILYCGVVLVVHRGRLENWSVAQTWLQGPDYCPLIGHNPGLLLACSLDITPWEDIYV